MYDIAIIGKGPAGISAAINAFARNKSVILFGSDSKKVILSPSIPNYPGLPDIKGVDFAKRLEDHLSSTNVETSSKKVNAIYSMGNYFSIQAEKDVYEAETVILATGVDFKKSIEGEDSFLGMGVSYCATCDAPLYKGKITTVIGYNEESYKEADFLSEICTKVYFVPVFKMEYNFNSNVEIINDTPLRFEGSMKADRLVMKNSEILADGFFVIKDSYPVSSLVPGLEVDGPHVVVNRSMETNIKGLYAAGDITGRPYQIAKAVGEGQIAVLSACDYLDKKASQ
ncbi:thioredoxin reductase [Fervidicella metallireducens AeB]|uniref:Thioredoxin reductase n=1 Tax=Fervidicella metallireducens AeB TaxID=1403537 RepID=A0A017S082_9CLOT|nr:NAD(P)/FAD-dependent oxidoreductase [Fervidicella metallireducens]EYE89555.1 thioredoxin reductase [Fervidicella metallireducens AeB]